MMMKKFKIKTNACSLLFTSILFLSIKIINSEISRILDEKNVNDIFNKENFLSQNFIDMHIIEENKKINNNSLKNIDGLNKDFVSVNSQRGAKELSKKTFNSLDYAEYHINSSNKTKLKEKLELGSALVYSNTTKQNIFQVINIIKNQYTLNPNKTNNDKNLHDGRNKNFKIKFLQSFSGIEFNTTINHNDCNKYKDCFNCTMKLDNQQFCSWTNGVCSNEKMQSDLLPWYEKFQQCMSDFAAISTMRRYCGEVLDKVFPYEARMKAVNKYYGDKNLYCKWRGINSDSLRNIIVNFTNLNMQANNKFFLEIVYYNNSALTFELNSPNFVFYSQEINYITFHFYASAVTDTLPFTATFSIITNSIATDYFYVFIIIGLVILTFVIIVVLLIRFSKVFSKKAPKIAARNANNLNSSSNSNHTNAVTQRMIENFIVQQNEYLQRIFLREEKKKKKNLIALEKLFSDDLKSTKFNMTDNQHVDICGNCTICLEDFISDTEIITLSCKHSFHLCCLKNWLLTVILNPKCPNCNDNILDQSEESSEESISDDEIGQSQSNYSHSISRVNVNNYGEDSNRPDNMEISNFNQNNIVNNTVNTVYPRTYLNTHHNQINNNYNDNNIPLTNNPIRFQQVYRREGNTDNNNNNSNIHDSTLQRNFRDEAFNNITSISIDNRSIYQSGDNNGDLNNNAINKNNININRNANRIDRSIRNQLYRHNTNNYVLGEGDDVS